MAKLGVLVAALLLAASACSSSQPAPTDGRALLASLRDAVADPPSMTGLVEARFATGVPAQALQQIGRAFGGTLEGSHRLRIWRAPGRFRAAVHERFGEIGVWASEDGGWQWQASEFVARRAPAGELSRRKEIVESGAALVDGRRTLADPLELARMTLATPSFDDPSLDPTVGGVERVAGRDAVTLRLRPARSRVAFVEIAVDARNGYPLRVGVVTRGSPNIEASYRSIRFGEVADSVFDFTPPDGAQVARSSGFPQLARFPRVGAGWEVAVAVGVPSAVLDRPIPGGDQPLRSLFPFASGLYGAIAREQGGDALLVVGTMPPAELERIADSVVGRP